MHAWPILASAARTARALSAVRYTALWNMGVLLRKTIRVAQSCLQTGQFMAQRIRLR
jgi:hypothetical protein